MEKLNDVLKPLIGMLLLVTFIVAFSSCEQQTAQEVMDKDTVRLAQENQTDEDSVRWKIEEETKELQVRFDSLKIKARQKGKQAEKEVEQAIDKLNKERKDLVNENTEEKLEDQWGKLKQKSRAVIDSLDKKL